MKNDITGDSLITKPGTKAYEDGWDRIFGKGKVMATIDDMACDAEQRDRDICMKHRLPELPPIGSCHNCQEVIEFGCFCDSDCRDDYEKREKFNKGRE